MVANLYFKTTPFDFVTLVVRIGNQMKTFNCILDAIIDFQGSVID